MTLCAPLALLAIGEVTLRWLWPQTVTGLPAGLVCERAGLAFMQPGAAMHHRSRDFQVTVQANPSGYRAGVGSEDPHDAVWVLGDSFAFGWGVEAAETATARLMRSGWKVINVAIPADGLPEYARRLDLLARTGARPAAVLIMLFDNDLVVPEAERNGPSDLVRSVRARTAPRTPKDVAVDTLVGLHVANLVGRGLRIIGLGGLAGDVLGFRAARERLLRRDLALHRRGYLETPAFGVHGDRLRGLVGKVRELGAPLCVVRIVGQQTGGKGDTDQVLAMLGEQRESYDFGQVDRALERLLLSDGVRYLRFPADTEQEIADLYLPWDGHLSAKGQAKLAVAVEPILIDVRP